MEKQSRLGCRLAPPGLSSGREPGEEHGEVTYKSGVSAGSGNQQVQKLLSQASQF